MVYRVKEYLTKGGRNPYRNWLFRLDKVTQARIQARIFRFELGNLGDYKSVGKGVFEARLQFGAGYRVYFGFEGRNVVILLCGGDKRTQTKDIRMATQYWQEYLEIKNGT